MTQKNFMSARALNMGELENVIYKIMTQKNFMSARALNMGELENVNGGIRVKGGTPKKETFGIRVK